jgi:hypothetical protein
MFKSGRMKWEKHVVYVEEKLNVYRVLVGNLKKVGTCNIWGVNKQTEGEI